MKKSPIKKKEVLQKLSEQERKSRKFDNQVNELLDREKQFCTLCGFTLFEGRSGFQVCFNSECEGFLDDTTNSQLFFEF